MFELNRDQKKMLEKVYRKSGKSRNEAKKIAQQMYDIDKIRLEGTGETSPPQKFQEDTKFKLDIEKIKARKNYERMNENYKQFLADNVDTVFTAHVDRGHLISAKEEPRWLFWSGDLIKVEETRVDEPKDE